MKRIVLVISPMWYVQVSLGAVHVKQLRMRSDGNTLQTLVFHKVRASAYWQKIDGICACAWSVKFSSEQF